VVHKLGVAWRRLSLRADRTGQVRHELTGYPPTHSEYVNHLKTPAVTSKLH